MQSSGKGDRILSHREMGKGAPDHSIQIAEVNPVLLAAALQLQLRSARHLHSLSFYSTISGGPMRYSLVSKHGRITDGALVAALTQALTRRGVGFKVAVETAARLQAGETVQGVEIELVFSRDEFESEMETHGIHAEWGGGEPREPFTLNLMPDQARWRGVWPKAVASALKTHGLPEDEADDLGMRLAAGNSVDGVVLRWVPSRDEHLVIEHLEGYGARVTKVAGG
jgi:hypothetical protein